MLELLLNPITGSLTDWLDFACVLSCACTDWYTNWLVGTLTELLLEVSEIYLSYTLITIKCLHAQCISRFIWSWGKQHKYPNNLVHHLQRTKDFFQIIIPITTPITMMLAVVVVVKFCVPLQPPGRELWGEAQRNRYENYECEQYDGMCFVDLWQKYFDLD